MDKLKKTNNWAFLYSGLFLISVSLLGVELLLTRVAKVSFGQGFQFILISLAILGIGIGAMIVYFFINSKKYRERCSEKFITRAIFASSLLYSILIFLPFFVVNNFVIDFEASYTYGVNEAYALKFFFFLTAFVLYTMWGVCVSLILSYYSKFISSLYFSNLLGSAVGGFAAIFLMNFLGIPKTIFIIYILSFAASIFFCIYANVRVRYVLIISLLLAGYSYLTPKVNLVCDAKSELIYSETNSFSQVDTYQLPPFQIKRDWGTDYNPSQIPKNITAYRMIIDCIGGTDFIEYGKNASIKPLLQDSRIIPHLLKNYSRVLIVGSGAGVDVVRAAAMNSKIIDSVEINPLIIERTNKLVEPEMNVYNQKNVNLYVEEARNFISKSNETYDFIYIPGAKRYGGASIALYAFLENYLFTEEAFEAYFNHLTEDGVLAIIDPTWFTLRHLQAGAIEMEKLGIPPQNKAVLIMGNSRSVLIFKKNGFTGNEKKVMIDAAAKFKSAFSLVEWEDIKYLGADYAKITDDHPFYWNIHTSRNLFSKYLVKFEQFSGPKRENFPSLDGYFTLLFFVLIIYLVIIAVPLSLNKSNVQKSSIVLLLLYFSALGMGFVMVELVLMQKFVLLLGHPVYAMAVIISALLFFSGLGSLATARLSFNKQTIILIALLIFASISVFILSWSAILPKFIHAGLPSKIAFSTAFVAVPAFFMGMLFPLGIKLTEKISSGMIPWMWGINGAASTLGGVASMIISLLFGFNAALFVGVIVYVIGAIAISNIKNKIYLNHNCQHIGKKRNYEKKAL